MGCSSPPERGGGPRRIMREAQTAHGRDVLKASGLPDTNVGTQDAKDPSYIERKGAPRNRGALFFVGDDADCGVKHDEK